MEPVFFCWDVLDFDDFDGNILLFWFDFLDCSFKFQNHHSSSKKKSTSLKWTNLGRDFQRHPHHTHTHNPKLRVFISHIRILQNIRYDYIDGWETMNTPNAPDRSLHSPLDSLSNINKHYYPSFRENKANNHQDPNFFNGFRPSPPKLG